ncbi:unnamed protein product [Cyclocybe aegerita]|uniref:F-box domain-containing protein n=1 Tax=Cyclocybe aegerita TaxID=1973307 RepID=A0A8S0WM09_CYCAE|nr:unnamed protein product [Cyclocybe aegerita]
MAGFAKLDELSVGFRTLHLSAPQKMPQKTSALDVVNLHDVDSNPPISKIPVEILWEVFTKFVDDPTISRIENPTRPLVSRHSSADPTILGQVCSHWRSVALNLPTLWSTIFIRNPAKSQLYRTHLWLERSADQPLNLTLEDGIDDRDLNTTGTSSAPSTRARTSGEELISAYLPTSTSHPFSNDFRQHEFFHPLWQFPYHDEIWAFFNSSPKLQNVSYFADRPDILPQNTPYGQLTSVEILFFLSPEDLLSLMSLLPNLCNLRADVVPSRPAIPHSIPPAASFPVTLKDLRTLQLSVGLSLTKLFSQLVLPSLEELLLSFHFLDGETEPRYPAIQNLLQRSECRLRKLKIVDRKMTEADSNVYFEAGELQGLSFLELGANLSTKSTDLLLEKMPARPHTFLPNLHQLHLSGISNTPDGKLSEMISSRLPLLRRFTILTTDGEYGPLDEAFFAEFWDHK